MNSWRRAAPVTRFCSCAVMVAPATPQPMVRVLKCCVCGRFGSAGLFFGSCTVLLVWGMQRLSTRTVSTELHWYQRLKVKRLGVARHEANAAHDGEPGACAKSALDKSGSQAVPSCYRREQMPQHLVTASAKGTEPGQVLCLLVASWRLWQST